jgi:hypothetical protein
MEVFDMRRPQFASLHDARARREVAEALVDEADLVFAAWLGRDRGEWVPMCMIIKGRDLEVELAAGQSLTAKLDVIPCVDGREAEALRQAHEPKQH